MEADPETANLDFVILILWCLDQSDSIWKFFETIRIKIFIIVI